MCGIAGILSKKHNPVADRALRNMLSCMVHRGPEAEGIWNKKGLALGHRRLKILDLSDAANQPFTDGSDVLVFNGEIFNYAALREELSSRYVFKTRSDAEVLFRCLQAWGEKALDKLRGQFAFAFYRQHLDTLLLARDHVGICPLYITETEDAIYFASEINPLLTLGPRRIDPQAVVDYFTYRYNIQNGLTLFEGIRRFPPAHYLCIDRKTGTKQEKRYWRLHFDEHSRPHEEIQEEFNSIFDKEITAQKMGDVPVGMYLSGGIDSGALLCGFAKTTQNISSYTLRFSEQDIDFTRVQELTNQYRFRTHLIDFSFQNFSAIEAVVQALEEPFGDLIIAANYCLAQNASSQVRVVLSGEGGDEVFCGYDHQRSFMQLQGLSQNPVLRSVINATLSFTPPRLLGFACSYPGTFGSSEKSRITDVFTRATDPADSYLSLVSLFNRGELLELLSDDFKKGSQCTPDSAPLKEIFAIETEVWKAVMRAEIEQLTLIVNLLKQDRFGMRFSLEGRVPFVSRNILEFAGTLSYRDLFPPLNKQFILGYSRSEVIKKKPFSVFSGTSYLAELQKLLDKYVTEESVRECGILSWKGILSLRSRLASGGLLTVKQAMAVLVFIIWWRAFRNSLRIS